MTSKRSIEEARTVAEDELAHLRQTLTRFAALVDELESAGFGRVPILDAALADWESSERTLVSAIEWLYAQKG